MAWKKIKVCTKPSADTPYELWRADVIAHMKTNYKDTGKWTLESMTKSSDNLVTTYTIIFKDEAAKNEMASDSTIAAERTRVKTIHEANKITEEVTMNEEV
tara:strand:+ start:38 stop:340 length:303 start_codon:yes stop_codon:yes gene_type:complete